MCVQGWNGMGDVRKPAVAGFVQRWFQFCFNLSLCPSEIRVHPVKTCSLSTVFFCVVQGGLKTCSMNNICFSFEIL